MLAASIRNEGLSELREVSRNHRDLLLMNQTLRASVAEWTSEIRRVQLLLRGVRVESEHLVHQIIGQAHGEHVSAPAFFNLLQQDQFAGPLVSTARFSASTLAPELDEVPAPRLSVSVEQFEQQFYEAIPPQTPPVTQFNHSRISMQFSDDHEPQQAELAMLRQQNEDRQGGRRRRRRRRRGQQQMETINGRHPVPFQLVSQITQEQVGSPSNRLQLGQHQLQHNPRPSIISVGGSSIYVRAMFDSNRLPKAAAAA